MALHRSGTIVLVVDDDEEVRNLLLEVLEDEGYVVALAENGQKAIEVLQGGLYPALILLDLMMPVMDGWAFLEILRARWPLIPVTVVSAVTDSTPPIGDVPVIRKPIDLDALIDVVNGVCRP